MSSDEEDEIYEEFVPEEEDDSSSSSSSSSEDELGLIEEDQLEEVEFENINVTFHPLVCTQQALVALVSTRAKHLLSGRRPELNFAEIKKLNYNVLSIAEREIRDKLVNFTVRYTNPSGEIIEIESNTLVF